MKTQRRQQTNIMLAVLLLLATILAPWTNIFAIPTNNESGMQHQSTEMESGHQSMDHSGMSIASMDIADCCEPEECSDCQQDCGTCTVTPVIVVNATFLPNFGPAQDCRSANQQLFSNIPPPPNKPPV